MQRQFTNHRSHHAKMVCNLSKTRKQIAHPQAALTTLLEFPRASQPNSTRRVVGSFGNPTSTYGLPLMLFEHRFVVERINMAWPTIHETKDDVLRLRGKVCRGLGLMGEQPVEREHSKPSGGLLQEASSRVSRGNGARTSSMFHGRFMRCCGDCSFI